MPELPDITLYLEALESRIEGQVLEQLRLNSPFLLRSLTPPPSTAAGRAVKALRRIGKRIAIGLDGDLWIVIHLMIAGRLHWKKARVALSRRNDLLALDFAHGTLTLTEAGTQRRASLVMAEGDDALGALDPGGLEPLTATLSEFTAALTRENHTLKRALTDPHLFSGIGNAYSDEILHAAQLSPIAMTQKLNSEEIARLHGATRATLEHWIAELRRDAAGAFPEKVTAFREGMAAHGRFGEPCPVCGEKIQRIRYAANETNYCARCQTGGKLLADRALSRLLGADWPRSLEEMELRLSR
ncbi:MAG: formamidopyrimidine-DNA glycosylase [Bryobacteraceae bacterium]|nr:formamidopyrimidine-DNA glycosylase [Bryobacteraceae bacterium]